VPVPGPPLTSPDRGRAPRDDGRVPPDRGREVPRGDDRLPPGAVVGVVLGLTLLLSVWAAFLVPVRIGSTPAPLWLVPLVAMLALAVVAGRRLGLVGALPPAVLWLTVSLLGFGRQRAEGDVVVPSSIAGLAYLYGGTLLWAAVVVRVSAASRPARPAPAGATRPARGAATPAARRRR
jgi:hypothetical protein